MFEKHGITGVVRREFPLHELTNRLPKRPQIVMHPEGLVDSIRLEMLTEKLGVSAWSLKSPNESAQ